MKNDEFKNYVKGLKKKYRSLERWKENKVLDHTALYTSKHIKQIDCKYISEIIECRKWKDVLSLSKTYQKKIISEDKAILKIFKNKEKLIRKVGE